MVPYVFIIKLKYTQLNQYKQNKNDIYNNNSDNNNNDNDDDDNNNYYYNK